jgi:hypothetical protein
MSEIHTIIDVQKIDQIDMMGVEGGYFVADGYCGTFVPRLPLPTPLPPTPIVSVVNVLPPGLAAGGTIGQGP